MDVEGALRDDAMEEKEEEENEGEEMLDGEGSVVRASEDNGRCKQGASRYITNLSA